ncbi:Lipoma-preferred partner [Amphibalanus amphitrite]|uniref:Lipoma-preferred partner n=1 Tax=Amphibalanus amphitrite TaxID=1232801 RepID=A0A6A4W1E9_AMPAM|nr:lipoma-preferred partner homolog [Amphibalanus amphitrite]KAF0295888.1 Lipoma-preferred partner [Amphibalanus amphitrite]
MSGDLYRKLDGALSQLHITNSTPQGYSSAETKQRKVAPVVPPKPKKPSQQQTAGGDADLPPGAVGAPRLPSQPLPPPPEFSAQQAAAGGQELPPPPPPYVPSQYAYGQHGTNGSAGYPAPPPEDDLPPPPPPELYVDSSEYSGELPAPPSPVSSSYSELRRANRGAPPPTVPSAVNQFNAYAPLSQTSSTYESIYEPMRPRPGGGGGGGQRPARGQYPLSGPFVAPGAQGLAPAPSAQPITNPDRTGREAEVDSLTSLLVHGLDNPQPDFFGMCSKCGDKVVGEGTGCTAMDKVFHVDCFTCHGCHSLLQGRPFFAVENKPHCQECYMDTLERCSVCTKPILERILRATGKPYHPECFTCVVCGKSLDGVCFTVDAANQIHCIEDFHRKFAPKCSVCHEPIMPEPGQEEAVRVVALDRSFHVSCYKCEDCGLVLSSEAEGRGCYPLDGHVLCKNCNAKRVRALTSRMTTNL